MTIKVLFWELKLILQPKKHFISRKFMWFVILFTSNIADLQVLFLHMLIAWLRNFNPFMLNQQISSQVTLLVIYFWKHKKEKLYVALYFCWIRYRVTFSTEDGEENFLTALFQLEYDENMFWNKNVIEMPRTVAIVLRFLEVKKLLTFCSKKNNRYWKDLSSVAINHNESNTTWFFIGCEKRDKDKNGIKCLGSKSQWAWARS